jgi:tellurite resistance protein
MTGAPTFPIIPASFFGIVLGVAGLGGSWHAAAGVWNMSPWIGDGIDAVGLLIWAILMILYLLKSAVAGEKAIGEIHHPVQSSFAGLPGVATMLAAGMVLPYSRIVAETLFFLGAIYSLGYSVWIAGELTKGGRRETATSPALYLPAVAGCFVTTILAGELGYPGAGQLFLGVGLFSWLAIESVLLHRLFNMPMMEPAMRPTLGLQIAPPAIGAVAYLSATSGPTFVAYGLAGYAIFQALVAFRLLPWILEDAFSVGDWAFSFGIAGLATLSLKLIERGDTGALAALAPVLFIIANVTIGIILIATLRLVAKGKLGIEWFPIGAMRTEGGRSGAPVYPDEGDLLRMNPAPGQRKT